MSAAGARTPVAIVAVGIAVVALLIGLAPDAAAMLIGALGLESPPMVDAVFVAVVFGAMLAAALAGGALSGCKPLATGRAPGRAAAQGAALGLAGIAIAAGYASLANVIGWGAGEGSMLLAAAGLPVVALQVAAEEAYFRGWLQPVLARSWGTLPAMVAIAAVFALLHMLGGARGAVPLLNLFGGGLLFGLLAARSGGIAGPVAAHFAWNATEQLGLGLDPNPGTGGFGALIDLDLAGSRWWGGSEQGLNGSIGMTIALAALLVPLLWRARLAGGGAAGVDPVALTAEPGERGAGQRAA